MLNGICFYPESSAVILTIAEDRPRDLCGIATWSKFYVAQASCAAFLIKDIDTLSGTALVANDLNSRKYL